MIDPTLEVLELDMWHPEGPDFLPDGRLILAEGYRQRIVTWTPEDGIQEFAKVGGKPYATAVGSDGCVYVTQSSHNSGRWVGPVEAPPSIQRVSPDGSTVELICTEVEGIQLSRPNDLVFGPDGRLYFTDPGVWGKDGPQTHGGYIHVINADGSAELLVDAGPVFPNGIAFEDDGSLLWCESTEQKVTRRRPDGTIENVITFGENHHPEGLAIDVDGNVWVSVFEAGGIHVMSPEGKLLEWYETGGVPVNQMFGDGVMYIADFGPLKHPNGEYAANAEGVYDRGRLLRMKVPVAGRPLHRGAIARG